MLVYERESDGVLVIGAGIPETWLRDSVGVTVENLPTPSGAVSFSMRGSADAVTVTVSGTATGTVIVTSPYARKVKNVLGDAHATPIENEFAVDRLPAKLVLVY